MLVLLPSSLSYIEGINRYVVTSICGMRKILTLLTTNFRKKFIIEQDNRRIRKEKVLEFFNDLFSTRRKRRKFKEMN